MLVDTHLKPLVELILNDCVELRYKSDLVVIDSTLDSLKFPGPLEIDDRVQGFLTRGIKVAQERGQLTYKGLKALEELAHKLGTDLD